MSHPAELAAFPVVISLPLQWGDQDAFGHVNNTVPIRWFESARIAYLAQAGLGHKGHKQSSAREMPQSGVGPILAAVHCNYRRQLHYPDTVLIGARVAKFGRTSFTMEHAVYSTALAAISADGDSVIVTFDYDQQKSVPVPAELVEAIERLEGRRP